MGTTTNDRIMNDLSNAAKLALRFMETVEAHTGTGWTQDSFIEGVRESWHAAYVPLQRAIRDAESRSA